MNTYKNNGKPFQKRADHMNNIELTPREIMNAGMRVEGKASSYYIPKAAPVNKVPGAFGNRKTKILGRKVHA